MFAMVRRDELWDRGVLTESRDSQGQAVTRGREIVARDTLDDRALRNRLRDRCQKEMDRVRAAIAPMRDARVRAVVTATNAGLQSTVSITVAGISVVSTPDHAAVDYRGLEDLLRPTPALPPTRPLPIVWRNGSAAVLLHEAIGHASEHEHAPLPWPRWLRAHDVADDGASADLIAGQPPVAFRRESFRDIPLRRMTKLFFEQDGAPFDVPDERIEVFLVAGGAYEPLTEMISVDVAIADRVSSSVRRPVGPFTLHGSRSAVSRAVMGATGDPIRYPGVICSREGQELFVGSHAPVMVTAELL